MSQAKKPQLESLRATYVQDADTCDAGLGQELIIESFVNKHPEIFEKL